MSTVDGTLDSKPSGYEERDDPAVVSRLLLASGLMLFVELALIRWLGSSVVHLSYSRISSCWGRSSALARAS